MSELQTANVRSEVYILENHDQKVSTAKSQFSEEYDVPYSNLSGKIIDQSGYGYSYPRFAVVVEDHE